jgi:polyhydroxyalkanoate synthase
VNGIDWLLRDPRAVVGRTPYDVIYQQDKLQVRHYHAGSVKPRYAVPVLLVPPLMVKPFIFDLYPGRSLVATLIQRGFRVYLVDFGEPDDADSYVSLDNYVLDWMPTAVRETKQDAGANEASMVGYCMGGLFALMHTAANRDASIRNLVTIAAPLDASKLGMLAWLAKYGGSQVEFLTRRIGNVPGGLSSTAFRMLTPMKNVTRYADLFMNLYNEEYVNGFDAMNQWVRQFIDYPHAAFVQFTREFMMQNKLVKGKMRFGDKVADLSRVTSNLLAFAGTGDQVAPIGAAKAIGNVVGSKDKQFVVVPGGHMGVFAGSSAPDKVWTPIADWLAPRSAAALAARTDGVMRPAKSAAAASPRARASRPSPKRPVTKRKSAARPRARALASQPA